MTSSADVQLRPGAEPFFFHGGATGVLLIHGYSGSPEELRGMGKYLNTQGYTICGPLLAGHGSTPDRLFNVTWHDWIASASRGLDQLRQACEKVVIAGFSVGALVGAHLAAKEQCAGLVLMAPALRLRGQPLLHLAGVVRHVKPWYYPLARANFNSPSVRAAVRGFMPDADLDDPDVVAQIRQHARVPIGSVYEIVRLQKQARRDLRRVTIPTLIMQGKKDETVNPASAALASSLLAASTKKTIWFDNAGHQLTREPGREKVWQNAADWIRSTVS